MSKTTPKDLAKKRSDEKMLVSEMIALYCRKQHCYQPEMREKIRTVMRWAGPRMLPVHPVLSIKHVIVTMKARREASAGK